MLSCYCCEHSAKLQGDLHTRAAIYTGMLLEMLGSSSSITVCDNGAGTAQWGRAGVGNTLNASHIHEHSSLGLVDKDKGPYVKAAGALCCMRKQHRSMSTQQLAINSFTSHLLLLHHLLPHCLRLWCWETRDALETQFGH